MVAILLMAGFLAGQTVPSGSRYLILGTQRTATMQKELSEASTAGYRVVLASNTGGTEKMLLLEKSEDPEPREYMLIAEGKLAKMEEEMNAAASRGFRLLPNTVIRNPSSGGSDGEEVALILERQPRAPMTSFQYVAASFLTDYVVSFPGDRERLSRERISVIFTSLFKVTVTGRLDTEAVDVKLAEVASQGFKAVSLLTRKVEEQKMDDHGDRWKLRLELIVLFERSRDATVPQSTEAQAEATKLYHVMTGIGPEIEFTEGEREFSEQEFEEMLNNAARAGYHMLAAAPMAFPEMVVLVEKNPPSAPLYSYRVLMTRRISTLRKELLESAAGGWLSHSHGLLDTGGTAQGGSGEVVIVTERTRGSTPEPMQHMLLATTRTSTLLKELSQAAQEGFQVVTAGSGRGEVVVVLKRSKPVPKRTR